jgi:cytochrome c553
MKKITQFYLPLAGLILAFSCSAPARIGDTKIPKSLNAVVQNKCYGCHSAEGRSDKAKAALLWNDLGGLPAHEQVIKFKHILEVLEEGSMPPARFVEGNPDKKLTAQEVADMKKWAEKNIEKLSK